MVRVCLPFYLFTFLLLAVSCQREDFNDGPTAPEAKLEIAFNTTVSSNQQSTRADATIVNMGETSLLPTATSKRRVGIFGCYTGTHTWAELVTLSQKADPSDDEKQILIHVASFDRSLTNFRPKHGGHRFLDDDIAECQILSYFRQYVCLSADC